MANIGIYQNYLRPPKSINEFAAEDVAQQQNLIGLQDSRMKLDASRQAQADEVAARAAFSSSNGDLGKTVGALSSSGAYKPALSLLEQSRKLKDTDAGIALKESQTSENKAKTRQMGLDTVEKQRAAAQQEVIAAPDPDAARRLLLQRNKDGLLSDDLLLTALLRIPDDPVQFKAGQEQMRRALLGAEKTLPKAETTPLGNVSRRTVIDPVTQQPIGAPVDTPLGVPPGTAATNATTIQAAQISAGNRPPIAVQGPNGPILVPSSEAVGRAPAGIAKESREDADNLRKEFELKPAVKEYRAALPVAEAARKSPDTRSGDIQLAYAVGKVLDPDSVVREGELKLVGNAATVMERLQGELRTLVLGKGRLTPNTRKELQQMLDSAVDQRRASYDAERSTYADIARRRGYDENDIFVGVQDSRRPPKKISGQSDFDALPSGSEFIGPDGKRRRKP